MAERGFLMWMRDSAYRAALLADPPALAIAYYVAEEAQRLPGQGLGVGQCRLPGPAEAADVFGLTRKAYVCAQDRLEKLGVVRLDRRRGSGTIATLTDAELVDINPEIGDNFRGNFRGNLEAAEGGNLEAAEGGNLAESDTGSDVGETDAARGQLAETVKGQLAETVKGQAKGQLEGQLSRGRGSKVSKEEALRSSKNESSSPAPCPGEAVGGSSDDDDLVDKLRQAGVVPGVARRLVLEHEAEAIRWGLAELRARLRQGQSIGNPGGWLATAIENGPTAERTVADELQAEKAAKAAEAEARRAKAASRYAAEQARKREAAEAAEAVFERPHPTILTSQGHSALTVAFLSQYNGTAVGQPLSDPLPTQSTRDRYGLATVMIAGEPWQIVDIGMRMLQPHELAAAHSFPADYRFAGTKSQQVAQIGNSVPVLTSQALASAHLGGVA